MIPTKTAGEWQSVIDNPNGLTMAACPPTYTYSWQIGGWGSCSATCGGGTQTRSVTCRRSDGVMVADSYCTNPKPATAQSCNTQACPTGGVWAAYDSGCTGGNDSGIKVISPPPGAVNLGNGHSTVFNGTSCSPIGQKGYSSVFPSPCGTFGGAPRMGFLYNCQ
ncbi:thrombospondin type-1 domain-containing protein [Falsochrobactrum ovis]|uniref:thrombospondin type-1 domain-containing protein n=2 Tax=Falsochrobactrum ovis TaxID=1293442 RepID=UPI0035BBB673